MHSRTATFAECSLEIKKEIITIQSIYLVANLLHRENSEVTDLLGIRVELLRWFLIFVGPTDHFLVC